MTSSTPVLDRRRAALFAGVGVAPHLVALGVMYLVIHLYSGTEEWAALGWGAAAFFLVETVAGLACLIGGLILFRAGRREVGLGLSVGWVVGLAVIVLLYRLAAS